jgi:hypothetical protein
VPRGAAIVPLEYAPVSVRPFVADDLYADEIPAKPGRGEFRFLVVEIAFGDQHQLAALSQCGKRRFDPREHLYRMVEHIPAKRENLGNTGGRKPRTGQVDRSFYH